MLYGMTYEQYWYGDPWMAKAYQQSHILKRRMRNEELWIQGLYNLNAFQVAINNAFDKHKIKYIEKPFDIFEKTEAEKQLEIREQRQKLIDFLEGMRKRSAGRKQGVDEHGESRNA